MFDFEYGIMMVHYYSPYTHHEKNVKWFMKYDLPAFELLKNPAHNLKICAIVQKIEILPESTGDFVVADIKDVIQPDSLYGSTSGEDWVFLNDKKDQNTCRFDDEEKAILADLAEELLRNRIIASTIYTLPRSGMVKLQCRLIYEDFDPEFNRKFDKLNKWGMTQFTDYAN